MNITAGHGTQPGYTTLTYDGFGRTNFVTNGLGIAATTTYDLLDRPLTTTYTGTGNPTITDTYDTYGYGPEKGFSPSLFE